MNHLLNDSIEGNKVTQLRQAFDRTFALPPSLTSPEVEDLITIRETSKWDGNWASFVT